MKGNSRMVGAVVMGLSTWLLTSYVQSAMKRHHQRVTKKLAKEAHQSWEGEGGTIIDAAPRPLAR